MRKMLNTIQVSTVNNQLNLDTTSIVSSNYNKEILKVLQGKESAYNKYKTIRQIIADANVQDFESLYRFLFDESSTYAPNNEGMVAIHINEYSYQSNFRIDKEINAMALLSKLIELN